MGRAAQIRQRLDAERSIPLARYAEDGYRSRSAYLEGLAEEHGLQLLDIEPVVDLLGPNEDFDGLVVMIEDQAELLGGLYD